jgi:hypothetical protein
MAVYSSNVLLVMGLISTLALGAFGEKPSDEMLGTRSGIVLTLQLTTIAFKFVIADSLPKVSYDTTLDMYMNMCSIFLGIVFFENAIVARFGEMGISEDLRDILDGYFALTIAALWFAANAIFVYVIRKYIRKVRSFLGDPEGETRQGRKPLEAQEIQMDWPCWFRRPRWRASVSMSKSDEADREPPPRPSEVTVRPSQVTAQSSQVTAQPSQVTAQSSQVTVQPQPLLPLQGVPANLGGRAVNLGGPARQADPYNHVYMDGRHRVAPISMAQIKGDQRRSMEISMAPISMASDHGTGRHGEHLHAPISMASDHGTGRAPIISSPLESSRVISMAQRAPVIMGPMPTVAVDNGPSTTELWDQLHEQRRVIYELQQQIQSAAIGRNIPQLQHSTAPPQMPPQPMAYSPYVRTGSASP